MSHQEELYQLIADQFKVEVSEVNDSIGEDDLELWDSLGTMELVGQLEGHFGVKFNLLEIEDLKTVAIIKSSLEEKGIVFD